MPESQQEARRILLEVARAIDRRLAIEVRDVAANESLQVSLTHGTRHGRVEVKVADVLAAADDSVARHALRLRIKRATDTMLFRPMPDHRQAVNVKPLQLPGGQMPPRGGRGGGGRRP
jgi:hypothetical protein